MWKPRPSVDGRVRVVVATTVLLSFISFWRAAAIVLSDLGSTAFYVGGIVEQAIGKSAPWFVLGVMLFSYAVRALYIESSAMFVRAGVYRVVKEAMGGTLAKLSVSALLFDYVLTGPISGVSAGRYIAGLLNDLLARGGFTIHLPDGLVASVIAIVITVYFWWRNTKGLHESSDDALRIMKITTVMVVILILWCVLTLLERGGSLPPAPLPRNLHFSDESLGWLNGTVWPTITAVAIFVGFGHSILAMSGEESLAQVYREIERPKVKNLQRAGMVIFVYSLIFTALVSFFATAIIPDSVRPQFYDNLISGLAMHLVGPLSLRLLFQAFVVVVGFLILAGAANTVDRRIERRAESRVRRRRADRLVPQAAQALRHDLPADQPDRRPAARHDPAEPRRRVRARRGLRVRRDLELRVQRRVGADSALQAPDAPRPWRVPLNLKIRRRRAPAGAARHRGRAVRLRDRQPLHQGGGDDRRHHLHRRVLRDVRRRRSASSRGGAPTGRTRCSITSSSRPARRSTPRRSAAGRAACWCRFATTTRWRISTGC